ncbi:MAG: alpha-L-fucosidase [Bacteroidetes bacterium]|nr:alpha-L-fucosidase [Bacteroidota bacterium]
MVLLSFRRITLALLMSLHIPLCTAAQPLPADSLTPKMQWFADAKLGIFIHWGIYAVNGIDESWSFHNRKVSWEAYMRQRQGFRADRYDPAGWADLIRESGARYAVLTTKHHDGVALWDTRQRHYDVVDSTPARRDLIAPFFQALRQRGIRAGVYYSLIDWSHPDYPGFLKDSTRYRLRDDTARWRRFLQFNHAQLQEVSERFRPDLWWFDGDWEHSASEWEAPLIRQRILASNPSAIINGRLMGYGDYATPEQNFPVSRPPEKWWELCMTTNDNWGWQPTDNHWKSAYEVITIFADAVSNGGNLLLDIGPRSDGTIPDEQVQLLRELGAWNRKHAEAIFSSIPGLPTGHFYGPSTLSKDSTTLYLYLPGNVSGQVVVKGLLNKIVSLNVVGQTQEVPFHIVGKISWSPVPGLVYMDVPEKGQDKYMTVLRMTLDGPLRLYRGRGGLN